MLSARERQDLERLSKRFLEIQGTFIEGGLILAEIRDRKLYRETHKTFEAFAKEHLNVERRHAYRLIDGAVVARDLCPVGHIPMPTAERQVRPLTALQSPEQRAEVWKEAVEKSGGKAPTETIVRRVIKEKAMPQSEAPVASKNTRPKQLAAELASPRPYAYLCQTLDPNKEDQRLLAKTDRTLTIGRCVSTAARHIANHWTEEGYRDFIHCLLRYATEQTIRETIKSCNQALEALKETTNDSEHDAGIQHHH